MSVAALVAGTYSATFTAHAARECPPADFPVGSKDGIAARLRLDEAPLSYLPTNSNTVTLTATIEPAVATSRIRFSLLQVSDFPGDAMNHGTQSDSDPDFRIEAGHNAGFDVSANGMLATTTGAVNSASLVVTAFDYGARAKLEASLVDLNCPSDTQEIPRDIDDDWLPDAYENTQANLDPNGPDADGDGLPDAREDDDPDRPVVADAGPNYQGARTSLGLTGDGLVAFEEYRGFFTLGTHTRTSTDVKDVFAGVDAGVGGAIPVQLGFFSNLAGFVVHEIEGSNQPSEWQNATTRAINWQRSGIPGSTEQRSLRIVQNNNIGDLGLTTTTGALANQSPNETLVVEINVASHVAGMNGMAAGPDGVLCTPDDVHVNLTAAHALEALRETVAHECGHACHLEHKSCVGDRHVIPENQGWPNTVNITSGPNGICQTSVAGDDIQMLPVGRGVPNATIITDG